MLRSTVAGGVAGAIGAVVGVSGAALWGEGFWGIVSTGAFDGLLSGLATRGVTNLMTGNSFFEGYSWQAAASDVFIGAFTSGLFYGVRQIGNQIKGTIQRYSPSIRKQFEKFASKTIGGWGPATWLAFAQAGGDRMLVYQEGDDILGALLYSNNEKMVQGALYIQAVEVLPEARNQGIARVLLEDAQQVSTSQGYNGRMGCTQML